MKRFTARWIAAAVLAALLALSVGTAVFAMGPVVSSAGGPYPPWTAPNGNPGPSGPGGFGPGWMMGNGSGQGYGPGVMGRWVQGTPNQPTISLDQAQNDVRVYLSQFGNADLALDEVMEFQNNFYAIVKEKSTGTGAFEVLIDKWTGVVTPEPGPNMMWNAKYGMMGSSSWMGWRMGYTVPTGPMTVSADQARQTAQRWLDQNQPGSTTEAPDQFYGYYTVHTLKNSKVTGMLSVNGYTGQVWYHTWHGSFIQMKDLGGES